ncbi:MAG: double-strand break repair helicase AddA [Alphaproteobacteria bacterium]|nr:double-strand break repair helicase AddA [Alphaproteobacteria bacterium SS10]
MAPDTPLAAIQSADVQQRRAADPGASVWVNASAGTGKTKVLTDRVLRLLLDGVAPTKILCVTFTKAGAAEMAIRLQQRLGEWAVADEAKLDQSLADLLGLDGPPEQMYRLRARGLFSKVLEAPGGLQIQTIHSFCTGLLRRFPVEAGVSPRFRLIEDAAAEAALAQARQRVLAGTSNPPEVAAALEFLTGRQNADQFADTIGALIDERGRFARELRRLGSDIDALLGEVHRAMGVDRSRSPETYRQDILDDPRRDLVALRAATADLSVDAGGTGKQPRKTAIKMADAMAAFLAAEGTAREPHLDAYLGCFFTKAGEPCSEKTLCLKGHEAHHEALKAEQARLVQLVDAWKSAKLAEASCHLLIVGHAILAAYASIKQRLGYLDFNDLILTSRDLLQADGKAAWVLYKLDQGIDHLLIDEAQDTNPEQWDIVRAIAEEFFAGLGAADIATRSLFVVGDDKQSIFSFQRASPETFKRMRAYFEEQIKAAEQRWDAIGLNQSFRTSAPVLQLVDAVFAQGHARTGVVADGQLVEHRSSRQGHAGKVWLWPLEPAFAEGEDDGKVDGPQPWALPPMEPVETRSAKTRLADRIADQIAEWLRDKAELEPYGRAVRPGDVMILVRSRASFPPAIMVRALQARGVPVAGADRMVLPDQLAVSDLLAFAEFLLLPEDDLTLACVLKSPLIGLDDEQLATLAIGRGDDTLRQVLRGRSDAPFAQVAAYLERWLARVDFISPYQLFAGLLAENCPAKPEATGRRAMLSRLGLDAAEPLDEFLDRCLSFERERPGSLQYFLDWLLTSAPEIKRDQEAAADEVRIMTVHGSKGLQAPIVILPDTAQSARNDASKPLWPIEIAEAGPPLWAPSSAELVGAARDRRVAAGQRREEEANRLLYVAMTRAADWLLVCGYGQRNAPPANCWYRLIEAGLDQLAEHETVSKTLMSGVEAKTYFSQQDRPAKPDRRREAISAHKEPLPSWAVSAVVTERDQDIALTPSGPGADEVGSAAASPLAEIGTSAALVRGRLVHTLLQWLPDAPEAVRRRRLAAYLAQPHHGLELAAQEELAGEVMNILDDPAFSPLFGPGSVAEVSVTGRVRSAEGELVTINGQIDRLIALPDRIIIVDYKTNRPPPKLVDQVPATYLRQLAFYSDLVGRISGGKPVESALLWTVEPRLMPIDQTALAPYLPGKSKG